MKIAILADNHKKVAKAQKAVDMLEEEGAEFFIHAGDIVKPEVLDYLEKKKLGYVAVYGNNDIHLYECQDRYNLVKEPYYFKLAGLTFKLMHLPFFMSADADVVVYGHTHIFKCEQINHTLYLNPGELCAREKPLSECAMLEIGDTAYQVTYYYRSNKDKVFQQERFHFERERTK